MGARPERLYGFYPETGGACCPFFLARFRENQCDKLRGLANGLSEEYRESTKQQMPWGMIRGMRNWLAHAYAEIDESVIWETATNDIPKLLNFCKDELK